jgi:hypothetical protein
MEIQDICDLYKITAKNGMYCLNDIIRQIVKLKTEDIIPVIKDKQKIGKRYYIDANTFRKIVYSYESEECRNIVNMLNSKSDTTDEITMLDLQYKIECEKTKQLTISRDMKILDAKMEHLGLARMRLDYGQRGIHIGNESDECSDNDCSDSECSSESDSENSVNTNKDGESEKYEEIETLSIQQIKPQAILQKRRGRKAHN